MVGYGTIDRDYGRRLATTAPDDDGPIYMVNLMRYRDTAVYADGRETTLTGRQADDAYTPTGPLAAVGAEIVFAADVVDQFVGDDPRWDRVAVVRYPTRRSFIEMQTRDDFQKAHEHKEAGMAETIVIGGLPLDIPAIDDQVGSADVADRLSEDDPPYTLVHVIRFQSQDAAAEASPTHGDPVAEAGSTAQASNGARIDGWFAAEGTIIGDGRSWHQIRFTTFASRVAFIARGDGARVGAPPDHPEAAIADAYAIGVRPMINKLAASVAS